MKMISQFYPVTMKPLNNVPTLRKLRATCLAGLMTGLASCATGGEAETSAKQNSQNLANLPVVAPAPAGPAFHAEGRGWELVWSDEFDGDQLDRILWEVEESCWGGGNDERQCYTDRQKNVEVKNGVLRLKAFREKFKGLQYPQGWPGGRGKQIRQKYTSGKVRTRDRADWTYGRFSARIKLPKGQGTWPAFWMLPADNAYGGWAASGEIDIMEAVNLGAKCPECDGKIGENRSSGALHFGGEWPDNTYKMKAAQLPGGDDAVDQYHVFTAEWGAGRINWFVDGQKFLTLNPKDWSTSALEKSQNPNAPFDQDFYLMFNLAVGGKYPEENNTGGFEQSSFPAQMLVDWVRVYQCQEDLATGRACMD